MSKGSTRRPAQISREEFERRWAETFAGATGKRQVVRAGQVAGIPVLTDSDMPRDELHLVSDAAEGQRIRLVGLEADHG